MTARIPPALINRVKSAILSCDFVAIDTELTGLRRNVANGIDFLDSPQQRYFKIRDSAFNFIPTQFGLCTFSYDKESNSYVAVPFNFFLFPRSSRRFGFERTFVTQASSFEFLLSCDFDFKKWIAEGYSWLNHTEENLIREKFGNLIASSSEEIEISDNNREYVEKFMEQATEWLQNSTEKTLLVDAPTGYHRRLVHQEIKKRFNSYVSTIGNNLRVELRRLSQDEREEFIAKDTTYQLNDELEGLVGFRRIVDILWESKKPVIGHNMFLDLCQTLHQFDAHLPPALDDWKKRLNELHPIIYDTKHIAVTGPGLQKHINITALGDLFKRVSQPPFTSPKITIDPEFPDYNSGEDKFHEAGYDAYCTGVSFVRMAYFLVSKNSKAPEVAEVIESIENHEPSSEEQKDEREDMSVDSDEFTPIDFENPPDALKDMMNRLYLMQSDMPYMELTGSDEIPNRTNVFHISEFPSTWTNSDIKEKLKPLSKNLQIKWIDETSCFVIPKYNGGASTSNGSGGGGGGFAAHMESVDGEKNFETVKELAEKSGFKVQSYKEYLLEIKEEFGQDAEVTQGRAVKRKRAD